MKHYSIGEVWSILGVDALNISTVNKKNRDSIQVEGFNVYRQSLRYATFYQQGTKCVCCGREGAYFKLEADRKGASASTRRHFNLYTEDGILMTKDHIRPRKLGGEDTIDNLQPMCEICNQLKGSKYDIEIPTVVGVRVNNPEDILEFLSVEDAVFAMCERKHLYSRSIRPGKLSRRVIQETLKFTQALKDYTPYCDYLWSIQNVRWKGKSWGENS